MTDILFFSCDPGGTNAILPIYDRFRNEYKSEVFGKGHAVLIWWNSGVVCEDIEKAIQEISREQIRNFLIEHSPSLVITGTSFEDRTENLIWFVCRELRIPTLAYVDSWMNYKHRFQINETINEIESDGGYLFPDRILCIDDIAKAGMIQEGLPSDRLFVAGYWHLKHVKDKLCSVEYSVCQEYRDRILSCDSLSCEYNDRKLILFISEPLYRLYTSGGVNRWGYDERSIFKALSDVLRSHVDPKRYVMVIRPHPKEDIKWWLDESKKSGIPLLIDNETQIEHQIICADLIVGMYSQCLNEAACIGKCIASVQIGRNTEEEPFFLSKKRIIDSILDVSKLEEYIKRFFEGEIAPVEFEPYDANYTGLERLIKEIVTNGKISD